LPAKLPEVLSKIRLDRRDIGYMNANSSPVSSWLPNLSSFGTMQQPHIH